MRTLHTITSDWITFCGRIVIVVMVVYGFSTSAFAEERRYKIEAAYLYSFFNYITWPGYSSAQSLEKPVICVDGNDPIVSYLDYVRAKMANERTLTIRVIEGDEKAAGCHMLFVRHRMYANLGAIPNDTLVVFKPDDPLDRGGMIELSEDGERMVIKINQMQLDRNGFHISSRLLELAQRAP